MSDIFDDFMISSNIYTMPDTSAGLYQWKTRTPSTCAERIGRWQLRAYDGRRGFFPRDDNT